jgi:hypothetical protein
MYEKLIPELSKGYNMQMRVIEYTRQIEMLDIKYRSNENGSLLVCSGFEIGCVYTINLSFDNFSFVVLEGFEEDFPKMVSDLEYILKNNLLIETIHKYFEKTNAPKIAYSNLSSCLNS